MTVIKFDVPSDLIVSARSLGLTVVNAIISHSSIIKRQVARLTTTGVAVFNRRIEQWPFRSSPSAQAA
jgi:hypothetical protein